MLIVSLLDKYKYVPGVRFDFLFKKKLYNIFEDVYKDKAVVKNGLYRNKNKVDNFIKEYEREHGERPDIATIAENTSFSETQVKNYLELLEIERSKSSLDSTLGDEEGGTTTVGDQISADETEMELIENSISENPEDQAVRNENTKGIYEIVKELLEDEKNVIIELYGFLDGEEKKKAEVCAKLRITERDFDKIFSNAKDILQNSLAAYR